jgi:hypothetical protein
MKYTTLLLTLVIFASASHLQATPLKPYFGPVRDELAAQITLVTNTLPLDKKLQGALKSALAQIDKPGTPSLANDLKILGAVVPAINKTSAANVFHASLDGAVNNYLESVYDLADASKTKLAPAYPSKANDSAQKSLDALYATLLSAHSSVDMGAATKLIVKALSQWTATEKLIVSALKVPAPPNGVTANVTGASKWSFKSTQAVAVGGYPSNNVTVNSVQAILKSPYGMRSITFSMYGLHEGANTLSVSSSDCIITEVYYGGSAKAFGGSSGTIQVNYNSTTKTVAGTFNLTLHDQDNPGVITATGGFSANIQ